MIVNYVACQKQFMGFVGAKLTATRAPTRAASIVSRSILPNGSLPSSFLEGSKFAFFIFSYTLTARWPSPHLHSDYNLRICRFAPRVEIDLTPKDFKHFEPLYFISYTQHKSTWDKKKTKHLLYKDFERRLVHHPETTTLRKQYKYHILEGKIKPKDNCLESTTFYSWNMTNTSFPMFFLKTAIFLDCGSKSYLKCVLTYLAIQELTLLCRPPALKLPRIQEKKLQNMHVNFQVHATKSFSDTNLWKISEWLLTYCEKFKTWNQESSDGLILFYKTIGILCWKPVCRGSICIHGV